MRGHDMPGPMQGPVVRVFRPGAFGRQRPDEEAKDGAREDFNSGLLVPETISSEKANLLNGRQKTLRPSQVQPVQ